jgi:hypothetical protein
MVATHNAAEFTVALHSGEDGPRSGGEMLRFCCKTTRCKDADRGMFSVSGYLMERSGCNPRQGGCMDAGRTTRDDASPQRKRRRCVCNVCSSVARRTL